MNFDNDYYVISKDFKLISFNKAVEERYKGIKVGDYCYKATMNRNSPCLHCPIAGNAENENPIYFDPFYNGWVQANFTQISDNQYGVICYPANSIGMELITQEQTDKVKKEVVGKDANKALQTQIHEQTKIIEGFKGIFFSTFLVDLENNYYRQIFLEKKLAKAQVKLEGFADAALKTMVEKNIASETKGVMSKFNDFSTMAERIGDNGMLSQDYIGLANGWCRASIIPIERNSDGKATKVIYGTSVIREEFKDPLTRVNSRKALNWAYDASNKSEESIAIILCDINGLKTINDKEGHDQGDQYLIKASNLFAEFFGINSVYRIGGDEFVIVIVGAVKEVIGRRVLDLKKQCEAEGVSVSLGYEYREAFSEPFGDILKEADKKMYAAKKEYYKKNGTGFSFSSGLLQANEYFDSLVDLGSSCYMVCRVDIKKNTFNIVRTMEGYDTSFLSECKTMMDLFFYPVKKNIIYSEDVDDYVRWTNSIFSNDPEVLKKMPAKKDTWIRYRSNYNKKSYWLTEVMYFPGRNFSEDNQYGYVYLMNKGNVYEDGNMRFGEVLKNLSENFETIFYIEMDTGKMIPYRISKHAESFDSVNLSKEGKLTEGIQNYIDTVVCEYDREDMRRICSREFLEEQLKVKSAYTRDYSAVVDGNKVYYRVKFSNMDGAGALRHLAVGFANINSEILHQKEYKVRGSSILIVEDSVMERAMLKDILEPEYKIIEVTNGLEAQKVLMNSYQEISMIITDLEMPRCNGYELLEILRQSPFYKNIPILVITSHNDEATKISVLEMGAADFINKPYNSRLILNRISSILKLNGLSAYLNLNEIDPLTGLYTREAFYRYAEIVMDRNPGKNYVIVLSDVVGFKAINEKYGKEKGDELLQYLSKTNIFNNGGVVVGGRIGGDVNACLLPEEDIVKVREENLIAKLQANAPVPNVTIKFGLYFTRDGKNISVQQMCDRAGIALNSIKKEYGLISAKYDDKMRNNMLLEQQIVDSMETALDEEQFSVYFQPKHNVNGKELSGAETLVRWNHPVKGFMNPGLFIPLFEKNGFISKLDRFIWRKSCEEIAYWIKQGNPFPISVNVSRKDFSDPDLAEYILQLTNEYEVPHHLLHIEVTESAYSDNPELLKKTVGLLHSNGFVIELDDFGTGYSSLTAINSFDIDILKLDISLIKDDFESSGNSVLEFSMQLAKMMDIKTIQEGVETEEEYNRMKSLGCDYIQGFYFSKPLPQSEFRKYVEKLKG